MFSQLFHLLSVAVHVALVFSLPSAVPLFKRAPAQVITKCTAPNTVALTFDDGPFVYLYDVSRALSAANAVGTFFFNGNNFGGCIYNDDQVQRVKFAYENGHQVASHTWSHAHLSQLSSDQLQNEFSFVEDALGKITGAYPAFTRPPYGEYNDLVRDIAGAHGQTLVNWDFDSGDTWGITTAESNQRYADLITTRPTTILTLNHEVRQETVQVILPYAIKALQDAGYRLVSVAECLGMPAYQRVAAPQAPDATWTCNDKPAIRN